MGDFSYELKEKVAVLSSSKGGWTKEINLVSYNGAEAKIDVRTWQTDEESGERKMSKGLTLTNEEATKLRDALNKLLGE
jgi:hypothetical protein